MLTNIQKFVSIILLCCVLQSTNSASTNTALRYSNISQTIVHCINYIPEIVAGIYDDNFDNFEKVIDFLQYNSSPNFKADVLSALYDVMFALNHTKDPFRALPLYDKIEDLINIDDTNLYLYKLRQLELIRGLLLCQTIVPKGAEILQAAIYLYNCSHEGTTVSHLLDLLDASNETVSDLTVSRMVNDVHWILATDELLPILSNFSKHLGQNVDALLALHRYSGEQFQGDLQMDFFIRLNQLQKNPEYTSIVSVEKQYQVNAIFPLPIQTLLDGEVCFTQRLSNGSRFYIQECRATTQVCIFVFSELVNTAVFKMELKQQMLAFNFRSRYFSRSLAMSPGYIVEQPGGYKFNVYSSSAVSFDINWKVHLDGDQIIVQNMNSTMYLCAGNESLYAYTRNPVSYAQHPNECKWTLKNCKFVSLDL